MVSQNEPHDNNSVKSTLYTSRRTGMIPYAICQNVSPSAGLVWGYIEGWVHSTNRNPVFIAGGSVSISRDIGLSVSTVKRCLSDLRKHNMVETEKGVQGSRYTLKHESEWLNMTHICVSDRAAHSGQTDTNDRVNLTLHSGQIDTNKIPQYTPNTPREETATQSHSLSKDEAPAARLPEEDEIQNTQHADPSTVERDHAVERGDALVVFSQEPQDEGKGKGQSPTLTVPLRDPVRSTARARAVQTRERNPEGLKEAQARLEQAKREKAFQNN
jgi:hypothetical protein